MNVDEAERLGIALEIPDGDCPRCKASRYECGTRRSVRDVCGKVVFPSAECWRRSEWAALDIIQKWNEAETWESDSLDTLQAISQHLAGLSPLPAHYSNQNPNK